MMIGEIFCTIVITYKTNMKLLLGIDRLSCNILILDKRKCCKHFVWLKEIRMAG